MRPYVGRNGGTPLAASAWVEGIFQQNRIFPFSIYRGLSLPSELIRRQF